MVEPDRTSTMSLPYFVPFFGLVNVPMPPMFEMAMAFMNNMMALSYPQANPFSAAPSQQPQSSAPLAQASFDPAQIQTLVERLVSERTRDLVAICNRIDARSALLENEIASLRREHATAQNAFALKQNEPAPPAPQPVDLSGLETRLGVLERRPSIPPVDLSGIQNRLASFERELSVLTLAQAKPKDLDFEQKKLESRFLSLESAVDELRNMTTKNVDTLKYVESSTNDRLTSQQRVIESRFTIIDKALANLQQAQILMQTMVKPKDEPITQPVTDTLSDERNAALDSRLRLVETTIKGLETTAGNNAFALRQVEDSTMSQISEATTSLAIRIDQLGQSLAQAHTLFNTTKGTTKDELRETELSLLSKMTETGTGLASRLDVLDKAFAELNRLQSETQQRVQKVDLSWDEKLREVQSKIEGHLADYKTSIANLVQDEVLSAQKKHATDNIQSLLSPRANDDMETRIASVERLMSDTSELQNELLSAIEEAFVALFRKNVLKMTDLAKPVQDRLTARLTSLCLTPVISLEQSKA